jgi:cysteine desulfurase
MGTRTGESEALPSAAVDIIYLDHAASTPCDPRVVEAMLAWFTDGCANPASRGHVMGRAAADAVERARATVAAALGAAGTAEIVFTSGATESNTLALRGIATHGNARRRRLVTQVTEHPSVLAPLRRLEREGFGLRMLGVAPDGRIDPQRLADAVDDDTLLVSLMLANHETGTLQPVPEVAEAVRSRGALLHCDASQAVGKVPVDVGALGVDLLTFSGHKVHGPKGVGGLWIGPRARRAGLRPVLEGGGQEGGLRSGTVNVPAAVGLARALELAVEEMDTESVRVAGLRDRLEELVLGVLDGAWVNGAIDNRLPTTSSFTFAGLDGNALVASLPELAVSTGAACASDRPEPSAVLRGMGIPRHLANASLRVSVGRFTTGDDVDRAAARIVEEVGRLRSM